MKNISLPQDRLKALITLSQAFANNKSVTQITGPASGQNRRRFHLMDYATEEALEFGKLVSDDSGNAYAIVIFKDQKRFSIKSYLRTLKFIALSAGFSRVFKILKKENSISRLHQSTFGRYPLYYVWFIGVLDSEQGKGYGSKLLRELMLDAVSMDRILILETSAESNLSFYWKAGLECYQTLDIGFPLYCFRSED